MSFALSGKFPYIRSSFLLSCLWAFCTLQTHLHKMKTLVRLMHKYKQHKHNVFHILWYRTANNFIRIKRFERHNDAEKQKHSKAENQILPTLFLPLFHLLHLNCQMSWGNLCLLCLRGFCTHKKNIISSYIRKLE